MSKKREHVAYRRAAAAESADRPPLEAQNTEGFAQNSEHPPPHPRARRRVARNRHANDSLGGQALVFCRVARGNSPSTWPNANPGSEFSRCALLYRRESWRRNCLQTRKYRFSEYCYESTTVKVCRNKSIIIALFHEVGAQRYFLMHVPQKLNKLYGSSSSAFAASSNRCSGEAWAKCGQGAGR